MREDPADSEKEVLPWGLSAWKERGNSSPRKFPTFPELGAVIYSNPTLMFWRLSRPEENQPHVWRRFRSPRICQGFETVILGGGIPSLWRGMFLRPLYLSGFVSQNFLPSPRPSIPQGLVSCSLWRGLKARGVGLRFPRKKALSLSVCPSPLHRVLVP